MRPFYKIVLLLAMLACSYSIPAQVYIPDRTFGTCGSAILLIDEEGVQELKQLLTLPNQKILLAGNFAHANTDSISILLVQYQSNGTLDTAGFAANGILLSRINLKSFLNDIILQPDGKIIALGHENNSVSVANNIPALYRFTSAGEFDSTLNGTGVVALRFDGVSAGSLYKAIVLGDGKIVAAGLSVKNGGTGTNGIGLMKLNSNGTTDGSFGNLPGFAGRSRLEMDSTKDVHLFLMSNKLVLPFIRENDLFDSLWIARLLPDGNPDNSFGTNGLLNTGIRMENLSAVLQQDGKLLMAGTLNVQGQVKKIELLRYTDALTPDASFGSNGYVLVPTIGDPDNDNVLYKVVQQADGKILIIGYRAPNATPNNLRPFIVRLLENGDLDSSFNGTGSMPINSEFLSGWNTIDSTDSTNFLVARTPSFELIRYVPNTTVFDNAVDADFDFAVEKQNVFFNDRSINGQNYYWDFGDGTFSQQVNPEHEYALPGSYLVRLTVSGSCDGETVSKRVDVRGIYRITPDVGPDRGLTICHIYGYGFDGSSQVMLKKNSTTLTPAIVFFDTASQTLQASFQFIGASPGIYDLIVTTGGLHDTLPQGFEIQPTEIRTPWVQLVGPYNRFFKALTGERVNTYRLEYGVTGNATQYLIPISLVIRGTDLNAEVLSTITNRGDTIGIPDSLKPAPNGFYRTYDELNNDSVMVFYAVDQVVEANMTHIFEFQVISKTKIGDFGVFGYIGNSLFDTLQLDTLYSRTANNGFCSNACITCLFDLAGFIPGPIGCLAGIVSIGCSINNLATGPLTVGALVNLGIGMAGTAVSCGTMTGSGFGKLLQGVQQTLFGYTLQAAVNGVSVVDCATAFLNLVGSGTCNGPSGSTGGNFKRQGSFDPNIKLGPASYNATHYIAAKEPLSYVTHFENLATATAPAYRVVITDTIDKSKLDIASFQFGTIGIAKETYPVFSTKDSFIMDIPITGRGIVSRVKGNVDTATGVVTWLFNSLDSSTMQLIQDQENGFLLPNIDSISGQAFVSFTVGQKLTNTHLAAISNKATIVFDFNAPIITPVWTNIVDTVRPQSHVLNQFRVLSDTTFSVKWTGNDADAGIRDYAIFVSENDSAYYLLGIYGRDSTVIRGTMGRVYKFISIAKDSVNNIETPPADPLNNPDAVFIFNSALPVKLLSFTAAKENETTVLKWLTSSEINSSHFIIEHSRDGTRYSGITTVRAAGNSSNQTDYSYTHLQPSKGYNYYRLKIIDRDGKFEYSPVRSLKFNKADAMTVAPNPATNSVYINIAEPGGILRLISNTGTIMKEIRMVGNIVNINTSALAQGIYFITYRTPDNRVWNEKLLIQRGY